PSVYSASFVGARHASPWSSMQRMWRCLTLVVVFCGLTAPMSAGQGEAIARTAKPPASRPTPRTADGKVDLSGIWSADRRFIYDINDAPKAGEELPIQP